MATSSVHKCLAATKFVGSRHCAAAFFLQVPKWCTDLDLKFPLHFYMRYSYSPFPQRWDSKWSSKRKIKILDGRNSGLILNEPFDKRPVMTIEDFSSLIFSGPGCTKFVRKKQNVSARRLLSACMLERWPQVCSVKITFGLLPNNWFVSTHKKIDELLCKVDYTECTRSFEPILSLP